MNIDENSIKEIVKNHGPIKARQIAAMLNNDYGLQVYKSDVNSVLYRLKSFGETKIDSNYTWTLKRQRSKKKQESRGCHKGQKR